MSNVSAPWDREAASGVLADAEQNGGYTHSQLLDALEQCIRSDEALMSNVSIGERRLTWRELVEQQREEIERLSDFARMVADLDRNQHGRHEGDIDSFDASGVSQGNPHVRPGAVLGYGVGGHRIYRMPPREQRHDPNAWESKS